MGKTERGRGVIERRRETDAGQTVGKISVLINLFWPKCQSRRVFWGGEGNVICNSKEKKNPNQFYL